MSDNSRDDSAKTYTHVTSEGVWEVGASVALKVDRAALGGRFLGYAPDGRVVWITSSTPISPGDEVVAYVVKVAKRSFEVCVDHIIMANDERAQPFCPHVSRCGGGPWQALTSTQQLDALSRDIKHLVAQAVDQEIAWRPVWFDEERAWRCTARLHSDGHNQLGFYGPRGLIDLDQCPVFHPNLNHTLNEVKTSLLPALGGGPSELKLSIAERAESGTLALSLKGFWSEKRIGQISEALEVLLDRAATLHGVSLSAHTADLLQLNSRRESRGRRSERHRDEHRSAQGSSEHNKRRSSRRFKSRASYRRSGQQRVNARARDTSRSLLGGSDLTPIHRIWGDPYNQLSTPHPAGAFMQAHQRGNQALIEEVIRGVGDARHILELYAGSGNLTLPLARAHPERRLVALEYDTAAVAALNQVAHELTAEGNPRISAFAQSIDQLPEGDFDHIVLDPPRAGAAPVIEAIAQHPTSKVTYISCHPAALARDLRTLAAHGWRVESARIFHLFPHSGHAEVYCLMSRDPIDVS